MSAVPYPKRRAIDTVSITGMHIRQIIHPAGQQRVERPPDKVKKLLQVQQRESVLASAAALLVLTVFCLFLLSVRVAGQTHNDDIYTQGRQIAAIGAQQSAQDERMTRTEKQVDDLSQQVIELGKFVAQLKALGILFSVILGGLEIYSVLNQRKTHNRVIEVVERTA